jgi:hypothetical protein
VIIITHHARTRFRQRIKVYSDDEIRSIVLRSGPVPRKVRQKMIKINKGKLRIYKNSQHDYRYDEITRALIIMDSKCTIIVTVYKVPP